MPEDTYIDDSPDDLIEDEEADEVVTDPPAKADDKKKDDPPTAKDLREMRRELKAAKDRNNELETSARYWSDLAKRGGNAPAPKEAEEDDALPEVDLVNVFTSNDPKLLKETLRKLGFVSQKEVDQQVGRARNQISEETRLMGDYPELRNQKSDFFKATSKNFNELVAEDASLAKDPRTIRIAAKMAKTELASRETEEERSARIGGQRGDRGAAPRSSEGRGTGKSGGSDELSPEQKRLIANLQAHGSSITEEDYKKRANAGVQLSGRGRK